VNGLPHQVLDIAEDPIRLIESDCMLIGLPHQVLDIAEVHIGGTLRAGQLERAATLCASYLGRRPELWQRWIRAFGAAGALPQLAPHVPLSNPQLPHETYEQVKTRL